MEEFIRKDANATQNSKGNIVIYRTQDKKVQIDVRLDKETIWLTQVQIANVFRTDRSVIGRHLSNILKSRELEEKSNVQKMHIAFSDKPVNFYSLDAIISVGYRVNSARATQFRIWATGVLKKHLIDGYTLNEERLKKAEAKYQELQRAVSLIGNVLKIDDLSSEARGIAEVISGYARALDILDDFDHKRLAVPVGTKAARYKVTYENAREIINTVKSKFAGSALVGQEKDQSFKSSLGAIYQTFGGKDVYSTIQEKAAHLLSFVDGNKRIAAALFVCFLDKNGLLFDKAGKPSIDTNALVALTLLIAASKSSEKNIMIRVILNLLAQ